MVLFLLMNGVLAQNVFFIVNGVLITRNLRRKLRIFALFEFDKIISVQTHCFIK